MDEDVYGLFREKYGNGSFYRHVSGTKWKIDLKGIIRTRMEEEGVDARNIHDSGICTKCRNDLFFHTGATGKDRKHGGIHADKAVRGYR